MSPKDWRRTATAGSSARARKPELRFPEAAIDCLAKHGYARTTTQLIAQVAEISRGAMLHHYATKQELIAAVIDYTFYKRMEIFTSGVSSLTEEQRIRDITGVERYWKAS